MTTHPSLSVSVPTASVAGAAISAASIPAGATAPRRANAVPPKRRRRRLLAAAALVAAMVPATADTAAAQSTCSGYPIAFPSENTAVGLYSGYTGDCYVSVEATYTIAGLRFTSDPVVGLNEARRTVSGQLIGIRACLADSDTCDTWGDFGGSSSK